MPTKTKRETPASRRARLQEMASKFGSHEAWLEDYDQRADAERQEYIRSRPDRLTMTRRNGRVEKFRSMWEREFAEWLDRFDLDWGYEPDRCLINGSKYTPDFIVSDGVRTSYVELHYMHAKGRFEKSAEKRRRAGPAVLAQLGHPLVIIDERQWKGLRTTLCIGEQEWLG